MKTIQAKEPPTPALHNGQANSMEKQCQNFSQHQIKEMDGCLSIAMRNVFAGLVNLVLLMLILRQDLGGNHVDFIMVFLAQANFEASKSLFKEIVNGSKIGLLNPISYKHPVLTLYGYGKILTEGISLIF